jgi:hypothetical protein
MQQAWQNQWLEHWLPSLLLELPLHADELQQHLQLQLANATPPNQSEVSLLEQGSRPALHAKQANPTCSTL